MTPSCERLVEHLGQGPLPPDLAAHARECQACAGMLQTFGALERSAPEPNRSSMDEVRSQALLELARQPSPTPWWWEAVMITAVSFLGAVLGVIALGGNGLILNRAGPSVLVTVAAFLLGLITWAAFVAVAPGGRLLRRGLIAFSFQTAMLVALAGSGFDVSASFIRAGIPCLLTEISVSAVPLAFALWLLLRSAYQPSRAFAAGLGTGAVGILALHLHCACGTIAHLLCFHVAPWLLLAGLAVYLRSRLPSRSFAP